MVLIDTAEKLQCNWPRDSATCQAHGVNLTFRRKKESVGLASRLCDRSVQVHITSLIFFSWSSHELKSIILINCLKNIILRSIKTFSE